MGRSNTIFLNFLIGTSGLLAIYFQEIGQVGIYSFMKPLTTILIILIPLFFGATEWKRYRYYITIGLVFCLLGDTLLLKDSFFVFGLLAFLIAHLLFALGFISVGGFKKYPIPLVLLLFFGISMYLYLLPDLDTMSIPVAVYMLFIIMMGWQALNLFVWQKKRVYLVIGLAAALFIFSDSMIALNKFKFPFAYSGVVILATYWIAIALIANSTWWIARN